MESRRPPLQSSMAESSKMRPNFITEVSSNDVLVGRGAPSNSNEGNKRYRALVQSRKQEYLSTGVRLLKDEIAREIVDVIIKQRGGRFIRKVESLVEAEELGVPESVPAWTEVPLSMAVQKTKQALRGRDVPEGVEVTEDSEESRYASHPAVMSQDSQRLLSKQQSMSYAVPQTAAASEGQQTEALQAFLATDALLYGRLPLLLGPFATSARQSLRTEIATAASICDRTRGREMHPQQLAPPILPSDSLSSLLTGQPLSNPIVPTFDLGPLGRLQLPRNFLHRSNFLDLSTAMDNQTLKREIDALPTHHSFPPKLKASRTSSHDDETKGDAAIRAACVCAGRPKDTKHEYLELTLMEIHLLKAMCSHGIPAWTTSSNAWNNDDDEDDSSECTVLFSWQGFAALLHDVSKEFLPCPETQLNRAIKVTTSKQVGKLIEDPQELPKRVISLLECVVRFANSSDGGGRRVPSSPAASPPTVANVECWLQEELCRWAASLEIAGDHGRPVPCCSRTLLSDFTDDAAIKQDGLLITMGLFNRENARDVVSQIACITRLRDIVSKTDFSYALVSKVTKVVEDCKNANKVWLRRPSWWGVSVKDPVEHDVLLLKKLADDGFRGVLDGDFDEGTDRTASLWKSLTKSAVQERAVQLLEFMHIRQVVEDRAAILKVRRKRFLDDFDLQTQQQLAGAGDVHPVSKRPCVEISNENACQLAEVL